MVGTSVSEARPKDPLLLPEDPIRLPQRLMEDVSVESWLVSAQQLRPCLAQGLGGAARFESRTKLSISPANAHDFPLRLSVVRSFKELGESLRTGDSHNQ